MAVLLVQTGSGFRLVPVCCSCWFPSPSLGQGQGLLKKEKKRIALVKSKHLFCFLSFIFIVLRLEPSSLQTRKALLLSHLPSSFPSFIIISRRSEDSSVKWLLSFHLHQTGTIGSYPHARLALNRMGWAPTLFLISVSHVREI